MSPLRPFSLIPIARASSSKRLPSTSPSFSFVSPLFSPLASTSRRTISTSSPAQSGHSRWSKIRHKKGAVDAQRGAFFSRLLGDVHMALRPPNSHDPNLNARLAAALTKARDGGVPKANIEAAFARARAAIDGSGQTVVYEAVGAGGKVAFMIECLTENPSRTVQRVKEMLHKNGARLSPVAFMFEREGLITIDPSSSSNPPDASFDTLFDAAVEAGAEDVRDLTVPPLSSPSSPSLPSSPGPVPVEDEPGVWEVVTLPTDLSTVSTHLTKSGWDLTSSEIAYTPLDPLKVVPVVEGEEVGAGMIGEDKAEGVGRAVETLEDDTDVVKVWTNISDE